MTCPRNSYAAFQTVPNQNWRELTHRNKKAQARTESILSSQLQKHTNSLTQRERERDGMLRCRRRRFDGDGGG